MISYCWMFAIMSLIVKGYSEGRMYLQTELCTVVIIHTHIIGRTTIRHICFVKVASLTRRELRCSDVLRASWGDRPVLVHRHLSILLPWSLFASTLRCKTSLCKSYIIAAALQNKPMELKNSFTGKADRRLIIFSDGYINSVPAIRIVLRHNYICQCYVSGLTAVRKDEEHLYIHTSLTLYPSNMSFFLTNESSFLFFFD